MNAKTVDIYMASLWRNYMPNIENQRKSKAIKKNSRRKAF